MKKMFSNLFMSLCILFFYVNIAAQAASTSGTCGDNLTWRIEEGTLYISGTGEMKDYTYYDDTPWKFRKDIDKIVIGEGVTKIGERAFYTCVYVTKIELPDTLNEIGRWAFYQCEALTEINIPEGVVSIRYAAFGYCNHLDSIVIPDSVKELEDSAFKNCSSLKSVEIGNSVNSIGSYTFGNCLNLKYITIPDSVESVDCTAFRYCPNMRTISVPFKLKSVVKSGYLNNCSGGLKYYYVIQYMLNDEILKKEYVYEGDNAILPEAPTGYTYSFSENGAVWDGTDVKENTIVNVTALKNAESTVEITAAETNGDSIKYVSTVEVSDGDEIKSFGTVFIPLSLIDYEDAEFAEVSYDNSKYDIKGSITFGATLTDIPKTCNDMNVSGRSYLELADGRYIWSIAKYASINDKTLKIVEE